MVMMGMFNRHLCPTVDAFVWAERKSDNPLDIEELERSATRSLYQHVIMAGEHEMGLYVTGLSPALIAVINAAMRLGIRVVAYHYDNRSGTYIEQPVCYAFGYDDKGFAVGLQRTQPSKNTSTVMWTNRTEGFVP